METKNYLSFLNQSTSFYKHLNPQIKLRKERKLKHYLIWLFLLEAREIYSTNKKEIKKATKRSS